MKNKIILTTERLLLTSVSPDDCTDTYLSWLNDYETVQYTDSVFSTHTMEDLQNFVKVTSERLNSVFLAIRIKDTNKHIGNIKVDQIHPVNKYGEYGILIGDKSETGKGYAKEASLEIIRYCFDELLLHRINLGVLEDNIAAVQLYKKIGFKEEGLLRECFYHVKSGKFLNGIKMGLLRTDPICYL